MDFAQGFGEVVSVVVRVAGVMSLNRRPRQNVGGSGVRHLDFRGWCFRF